MRLQAGEILTEIVARTQEKADLLGRNKKNRTYVRYGAGEGNRTLFYSLEGSHSTGELHPRLAILPRSGH